MVVEVGLLGSQEVDVCVEEKVGIRCEPSVFRARWRCRGQSEAAVVDANRREVTMAIVVDRVKSPLFFS